MLSYRVPFSREKAGGLNFYREKFSQVQAFYGRNAQVNLGQDSARIDFPIGHLAEHELEDINKRLYKYLCDLFGSAFQI